MATIQINALNSTGSDLFADSESYLQDLTNAELNLQGGYTATQWDGKITTVYWLK